MYDLRKGQVVKEFKGHVNDYVVTSFGVDEREEFLYAGISNIILICSLNISC